MAIQIFYNGLTTVWQLLEIVSSSFDFAFSKLNLAGLMETNKKTLSVRK